MKAKLWTSSFLVIALFGFSAYNLRNTEDKDQMIIKLMMQGLKDAHYEKIDINDKFSEEVYDAYIRRIDFGKRFLTQEDLKQLSAYKTNIDDQINSQEYAFFEASEACWNRRYQQVQQFYREILAQPFDFTTDDQVALKAEKLEPPKDQAELRNRWQQILKYNTMTKLAELIEDQNKAMEKADTAYVEKTYAELEEEARKKVLKNHDDWFARLAKIKPKDRRSEYLNTIVGVYDPHTNYFPPEDKENFDISMSGKLEGIGATLQEKDGYIKVTNIFPGSPSYLQGELKEGDLIMKVAQGDKEAVDIVDMPLDEAVKLIRGKKGTTVNLTVKKPDATIKVISIVRDVVIIDETFAKSMIVEDKNTSKRYGYIYLSRFYSDFNDSKGRHCAEDIRKELEKLKAENVEGVIFDLRNNGGGSLKDVVQMAGLFINKGPIVQIKTRNADAQIMYDDNLLYNGVQYDGKLVVMVNSGSASASEILAAAIQDYKRGVIVGSPNTFGKGTVQRFYNLDDFIMGQQDIKPLGSIKLTTQKFYRVNGGSTQLKGVASDIVLPDNYTYIEKSGEREQEHYLPWDEIKAAKYELWSNPPNVESLKRNSKKRQESSPIFQLLNENAKRYKQLDEEMYYTLNLKEHQNQQKKLKEASDKLDKALDKENTALMPITPQADLGYVQSDSTKIKLHEDWKKSLKKDVYVYEAMQILNDMR